VADKHTVGLSVDHFRVDDVTSRIAHASRRSDLAESRIVSRHV